MAKKKQTEELPKTPNPIGFTAKSNTTPLITFEQFFNLMRILDTFNNLVNFVKQENFNADNIRYYFPDDLVEVTDETGKTSKQLRPNFWDNTPPVEEVK